MWQQAAEERKISQLTPPGDVLDFIDSFPGLADAALQNPSYLLSYAPQLALPGAAGWLQETIDETFEWHAQNSEGLGSIQVARREEADWSIFADS